MWHQCYQHDPLCSSARPVLKKLHLAGRMKQKLRKSVCVCETCPAEITWIPPFTSVLSNDFLSTPLLGWVRKPPLWQELQEWEFFNHIFFPQSRRNHTEWKTPRTRSATGDTQTWILGFEQNATMHCVHLPVHCTDHRSRLRWVMRLILLNLEAFPWARCKQGAQHNTRSLCQMMMKGKLQR